MTTVRTDLDQIEKATMRRVLLRLVPFLMVCYFFALLDRVNIGFAALQMNKDLGLTPTMFGFAASLFFVSYFLVEVPSNLALQKVGARRWIARIMISWGLVTACMAFVVGPYSLYATRFILGAAEAGFFPGAILYLTYWLPAQYRARILATFTVSIPLATFLGSPLSQSARARRRLRPARVAVALYHARDADHTVGRGLLVRVDRQARPSVVAHN